MIKGVIFDLDGVITDTAKYHYMAWKKVASNLGIKIDEEFNESLKGISRRESLMKILEYGNMVDDFSDAEISKLLDSKNEDYKLYLNNLTERDILPGIKRFIVDLKANGYKISIASASQNASLILEKLNLDKYIDYIVDSSRIKNGKPFPDIFINAVDGIGLCIEDVVGIEDSTAGIEAMRRCNMKSIGICVSGDYTLDSTKGLTLEYVEGIE